MNKKIIGLILAIIGLLSLVLGLIYPPKPCPQLLAGGNCNPIYPISYALVGTGLVVLVIGCIILFSGMMSHRAKKG